MNITTLLILILATWRLSALLVYDDGPFDLLLKFRQQTFKITTLLNCIWCTSVWVAIIIYFGYQYIPVLILLLALSAGSILVDRFSQ